MASTTKDIPLHCNICPKLPNFSDVSHLLTHIASKGHLSNYYKVKVRSSHEEDSRQLVEAYDRWYAQWGVESLMSDRMNQKDKRRERARPANVRRGPAAAPVPTIETSAPRPARRAPIGNLVDPRLSGQQMIKSEPLESPTPAARTGPVLRHRPFAPHMQYWATESRASSRSYTNPDCETSSEYSEPGERRRYRYTPADSCAIKDEPVEAVVDPMAVSESTKLKGVYWPGMDLFDSAPEEMRRKRNQKKDSSVLAQLELNSQEVEAMELIFTPQGSFKRQRRISNSEYDDEEEVAIKSESPRPARLRPALARMDGNTRRSRQRNRPVLTFPSRTQPDERGRAIFDHGHNERPVKRKRGGFDVYQDADDDDRITFSQPASMTYLTSGFARQPPPSPTPAFAYKTFNEGIHYENKENLLPPLSQHSYGNYHGYPGAAYHHPNYAYDLGHDHRVFQYSDHVYNGNNMYQQFGDDDDGDDDDERTITAPPSPSTS